jgi:hypothetical protein
MLDVVADFPQTSDGTLTDDSMTVSRREPAKPKIRRQSRPGD